MPGSRADDERSVGDTRADNDVYSGIERLDDSPRPQVDVRRNRVNAGFGEQAAGVEVAELMAGGLDLAKSRHQVIAFDVGDSRPQAQSLQELAEPRRQTG